MGLEGRRAERRIPTARLIPLQPLA